MESNGQLHKVSIEAYDDEDFGTKSAISPNPIFLPVNPESFTKNYKVELNQQRGQGNQSTDARYKSTKPEELKLDFIFDGTKTVQGYNSKLDRNMTLNEAPESAPIPVKDQLKIFLDTVYNMNGDIHRPHFLKVKWGDGFNFQCILSNLDLNYTLFEPSGDPLRIKVSATFLNFIAQREREARQRNSSPDLTHKRMVKAGDRLDLMTYKIYKDPELITQIARINGLNSFRTLATGNELFFPPLNKEAL